MTIERFWNVYDNFSIAVLIILGVLAILCLLRAVLGPTSADRVVACNMMGTIVMAIIAVLAVRLRESYLADICLVYAMISFLAVIVLCKVYFGAYLARKRKLEQKEGKENGNA